MDLFDILALVGGLCLFLFGMNVMGDALERRAGGGLKLLLGKLTGNKFKAFLTGLPNIRRIIPTKARIGVKDIGFKSFMNTLSPEIPPRLRIHAVTVVPIFAPIITPIDCLSVIIPELTKPTTITVVADEL